MGQKEKCAREKNQAAGFLAGLVTYDDLECVEPDPPDIRVWHNGSPILNLELTEYLVDDEQVATNSRWSKGLWPKVDVLRRKTIALRDIYGFVAFSDSRLPGLRKREAEQFADEIVRLAEHVAPTLSASGDLEVSFAPRADDISFPVIRPGWHRFAKEVWPLSSLHLRAITFSKVPFTWPRWSCDQTIAGWTSVRAATFGSIFDDKDSKVREVLHDIKRFPPDVPLWLIIISDVVNDMTSHLFPSSKEDRDDLFRAIHESGYDLTASPFTEVWLYAASGRLKLRFFPPPERTRSHPGRQL